MSEPDESDLGVEATLGNVYIFNVTTQNMSSLLLNNTAITSLPGVQASASYKPYPKKYPRINASTTQTAQFADSSSLYARFSGAGYTYTVSLPTNASTPGAPVYPYSSDVLLFVFNSNVVVCTPDGNNYQSLSGSPSSQTSE